MVTCTHTTPNLANGDLFTHLLPEPGEGGDADEGAEQGDELDGGAGRAARAVGLRTLHAAASGALVAAVYTCRTRRANSTQAATTPGCSQSLISIRSPPEKGSPHSGRTQPLVTFSVRARRWGGTPHH